MRSELLKNQIQNFRLVSDSIVYSTIYHDIFLNNDLIYNSTKSIQEIYFNGNSIYTNTIHGDGLEINPNDKSVILYEGEFIKYLDSELSIKSKKRETTIYNINKNTTTIKPYRIFIFSLQKEYKKLVYYAGNNLTNVNLNINVTSLDSNVDYFSFPLSTLGTWLDGAIEKTYQVAEFCGIYENTLVCIMTNGAVLLLDIEKGEVKAFFKDAKVKGGIFQKEENSPLFLGLKHYTFIEINAESGELLKQVDIQSELKRVANIPKESQCWLSVGTSIYQDGLFYFYGDPNLIGVFDPISEKIIDYHVFDFDKKQHQQLKGGVENLQVKDGEIYCLDSLGNLYVLER